MSDLAEFLDLVDELEQSGKEEEAMALREAFAEFSGEVEVAFGDKTAEGAYDFESDSIEGQYVKMGNIPIASMRKSPRQMKILIEAAVRAKNGEDRDSLMDWIRCKLCPMKGVCDCKPDACEIPRNEQQLICEAD